MLKRSIVIAAFFLVTISISCKNNPSAPKEPSENTEPEITTIAGKWVYSDSMLSVNLIINDDNGAITGQGTIAGFLIISNISGVWTTTAPPENYSFSINLLDNKGELGGDGFFRTIEGYRISIIAIKQIRGTYVIPTVNFVVSFSGYEPITFNGKVEVLHSINRKDIMMNGQLTGSGFTGENISFKTTTNLDSIHVNLTGSCNLPAVQIKLMSADYPDLSLVGIVSKSIDLISCNLNGIFLDNYALILTKQKS